MEQRFKLERSNRSETDICHSMLSAHIHGFKKFSFIGMQDFDEIASLIL